MSKPVKIGVITRREYNWLKTFESLEPHEQDKITEFEKQNRPRIQKEPEPVVPREKKEKIMITKALLWKLFLKHFKMETGKDFEQNDDSLKNIGALIMYFAYDDGFFTSDRLVKNLNSPSFKKGLLIVGKFGNGKSSMMNVLSNMFKFHGMDMRFKAVSSHQLVTEWECISDPGGKSLFFERYLCKSLYIDDVKKEKQASNYGKSEIIKEILEKRYDKKLITFITCNYREGDVKGDLRDALYEFNRYGDHIYDRLFEMFNIIEFKGKSFRK